MFKMIFSLFSLVTLVVAMVPTPTTAASTVFGHVVAIDSGHGETPNFTGATGYCIRNNSTTTVKEVVVNNAVQARLGEMVEAAGGTAFLVPQLASRSDRVAAAEASSSEVLISIHHNGSSDTSVDYTKAFITQKVDKAIANPVYNELVGEFGPGKGIKNDGFGITVYGSLPGVLSESYFITEASRACDYVDHVANPTDPNSIVNREAAAMFRGLESFFSNTGGDTGGSGGGSGKCHPVRGC